jgi:hypothetical protein
MSDESMVELVARAIAAEFDGADGETWDAHEGQFKAAARAAIAAMPGWQPISSAPRDGTKVDLWLRIDASPMSMGWSDEFRVPEAWFEGGRWFHYRESGAKSELETRYITHWRPLPDPPALFDPAPAPRDGGEHG